MCVVVARVHDMVCARVCALRLFCCTGLTRVRRFQQDDAHIFCRPDQIKEEVSHVVSIAPCLAPALSLHLRVHHAVLHQPCHQPSCTRTLHECAYPPMGWCWLRWVSVANSMLGVCVFPLLSHRWRMCWT